MPEGDTLHRIATRLRPVLTGQSIVSAESKPQRDATEIDAASLVGRRVETVEARGKHLILALDDQRAIHSHLGMTGSWHVYAPGDPWSQPPQRAALAISTTAHTVVNFSPKLLEIVPAKQLLRDPYLRRLGPDLMLPDVDLAEVLPRLRTHNGTAIGEAVMNQTVVAGIGNVYKSESLFFAEIHPWRQVGELSDQQLLDYLSLTHKLMQRNRGGGMRTTRFAVGGKREWVYRRRGEECYKCGETIAMRRQGDNARSTYWCPRCQPE